MRAASEDRGHRPLVMHGTELQRLVLAEHQIHRPIAEQRCERTAAEIATPMGHGHDGPAARVRRGLDGQSDFLAVTERRYSTHGELLQGPRYQRYVDSAPHSAQKHRLVT